MNKVRHYVFSQRFVWVMDCYAVKFLLSYEGGNPAIFCLQMRLICCDVNIVHRPDYELVDADYWSQLGIDIDFDPLFCDYCCKRTSVCHVVCHVDSLRACSLVLSL